MASTSAPRPGAGVARIKAAAATLFSDNQSLYAEIRKSLTVMKDIGVDLERYDQSEMVKDIEASVLEFLDTYEDCGYLSPDLQSVGDVYQPGEQLTDFSKLFENEMTKAKARNPVHKIIHYYAISKKLSGMDCKHIYDKGAIMGYIRSNHGRVKCPVSACPKVLQADRLVCDALLLVEIDEQRSMSRETTMPAIIEDFIADGEESDVYEG